MAKTNDNGGGTMSFVGGLILGFIISTPVVAWLSPRSGEENREAITQQGLVIRRKVADTLRKPVEQVQEQIDQLKGDSVDDALAEGRAIALHHAARQQQPPPETH